MNKVSVDLDSPSPYIESGGRMYLIKRKLTYRFAFALIKKFAPKGGVKSILEVGTGSGFFLAFCRDVFPSTEVFGVEYDERLLAVTKVRAPFAHCVQGNAEDFSLECKTFDVLVSFQVIEHLYDPVAMIVRAREHLRPGGLLILTSPNLGGLGARIMGERWHGYRDDHVSLRTVKDWVGLVESQGFSTKYSGSTFFSGIPILNRMPLGIINWGLLTVFGALRWKSGESFLGAFVKE